MKGKKIGEGNTAEIFDWGDNQILKLYREAMPWNAINEEYQFSKIISEQGLPVPKVYDLIELEGRSGIIYEKITGISLLDLITKKPFKAAKLVKHMAELQFEYHQCIDLKLPDYKDLLERNIKQTEDLTDNQKSAILKQLEKLPKGNALCHGDFHPGNIMVTGVKFYILDWMTASSGTPQADVARSILLLKDAAIPDNIPGLIKFIIVTMRKIITKVYIKRYKELSGISMEEINRWRIVLASARLVEWVPESEKKALLQEIEMALRV